MNININLKSKQCLDSPIGKYKCYVTVPLPKELQKERKSISIDSCLQEEIYDLLFKHNIETIGCCCGHGKKIGYIQVAENCVVKMYKLGYTKRPVEKNGQGVNCFVPKSLHYE